MRATRLRVQRLQARRLAAREAREVDGAGLNTFGDKKARKTEASKSKKMSSREEEELGVIPDDSHNDNGGSFNGSVSARAALHADEQGDESDTDMERTEEIYVQRTSMGHVEKRSLETWGFPGQSQAWQGQRQDLTSSKPFIAYKTTATLSERHRGSAHQSEQSIAAFKNAIKEAGFTGPRGPRPSVSIT